MFFTNLKSLRAARARRALRVVHGLVGRGHSGKTALLRFARRRMLQRNLPSGLEFDVDDPRKNTELVHEYRGTRQLLEVRGLPATQQVEDLNVELYEGERQVAVLDSREAIGQVYTTTTMASPSEQQEKYRDHVAHLADATVLWGVISVPPDGSSATDLARYEDDLLTTRSYLREALRSRPPGRSCAVALVITKIDTLFKSEAEARRRLTDEELLKAVRPIVNTLQASDKVSHAIVNPVSAFGFGNAIPMERSEGEGRTGPAAADEGELVWVLRPDALVEPFNVVPLIVFSLLAGMLNTEVDADDAEDLGRICGLLRGDLQAINGWQVPVKGEW